MSTETQDHQEWVQRQISLEARRNAALHLATLYTPYVKPKRYFSDDVEEGKVSPKAEAVTATTTN